MSGNINILLAFLAGLLSFASPCILPLVPSYLSYVGGVSLQDLEPRRSLVIRRTLLFILGFTVVFVVLGILFSGTGLLFSNIGAAIDLLAGSIVMLLGLNMIFDFWKLLNLEKRFHFKARPAGVSGSFLVGMAFAAGWTPCVGPILAAILVMAGSSANIAQGALYLTVYSLGLGLPFLAAAAFFGRFQQLGAGVRKHLRRLHIAAGAFLVFIGALIAAGRFQQLNAFLMRTAMRLERSAAAYPMAARILAALPPAAFGLGLLFLGRRLQRTARAARVAAVSCGILLLVVAAAQLSGIIALEALVASWLRFQGI
ncbi:MAG: cytochrome c biogenesis protein CcdA [Spirochaetaceae bacterium]|nr:MAG: cytochrome c biogenesis protein CcdA [Spirochaetaceae bacterium]